MNTPAIEFKSVSKFFGAFSANDDISFAIERGTIHAIVGENGAGKSTLLKCLYGMQEPDQGQIFIDGKSERIRSVHDAIRLNIGMVHQHFMLVSELSVWENLVLGREPKSIFWDRTRIIQSLTSFVNKLGF